MENREYKLGLLFGVASFGMWGMLPLYWKLVGAISPYQIFAHRVLWSFVFIVFIMIYKDYWKNFSKMVKDGRTIKFFIAPAIAISINWMLYIWSVNNGYVVEASLGYYINPLMLTAFGSLVYKEKMTKLQKLGLALAIIGVVVKTVLYGRVPVIALILATSFSVYGLLKKRSKWDSLTALAFETLIVGIPSLIFLIFVEVTGTGIRGNLPFYLVPLILLSGIATATPLILYAESAKRLPLSVLGFIQFLSPTISLLIGVFVFKEAFDISSMIGFSFIWVALGLFIYSQVKILKVNSSFNN